MLGTLARLFLLRLLPRRLVPILALYEVYRLIRRRRSATQAPSRLPASSSNARPLSAAAPVVSRRQVQPEGRARVG